MTNNQMNVSLDLSGPQGSRRIGVGDNTGQNSVIASGTPSTIAWTLSGNLADAADFVPMTAPNPGFQWAYAPGQPGAPPAGVFDSPPPVISNNGNTLTITDNHFSSGTAGQWIYILRVLYNGTVYSTVFSPNAEDEDGCEDATPDTVRNPVIINR
jgi:hypothetical protein